MSAVQVVDVQPVARATRRHLRAVPSLPGSIPVAKSSALPRRRVILARRRFVAAMVILLVVCGAAMGARAVASGPSEATRGVTVEVQQGETLSEVAVRVLPDVPVAEGVLRLQQANNLGSNHVDAGEKLLIPAS